MPKFQIFLPMLLLMLLSCNTNSNTDDLQKKAETEIAQAEKDFEKMAGDKGIAEAFWFYADSNATIKRQHDTLITGKENIKNYYSADFYKAATVKWAPDVVNASQNGDLGWTYGKYTWQSKDTAGKVNEFKGVFHTVWKKQADGSWKYVWD